MAKQGVQMLFKPKKHRKLAELAKMQGKCIVEVTHQAIDIGLEKLIVDEQREQMLAAM